MPPPSRGRGLFLPVLYKTDCGPRGRRWAFVVPTLKPLGLWASLRSHHTHWAAAHVWAWAPVPRGLGF